MPTVSVIIPTFNRAAYIREAIDSVRDQSYQDLEIIVVDDGSTDGTQGLLTSLEKEGILKYVYQENKGQSAARNHGIRIAKGKYIAFLDSDDLFLPEKLEIQVNCLEINPDSGLVHSSYIRVDEQGAPFALREPFYLSGWIYPDILLHWSVLIAIPAVLVRTDIIRKVGGFDEHMMRSPNEDLWRRIARITPFMVLKTPTCKIRRHSGNYSANQATAVHSYSAYLQNAFDDDPDLGRIFRRRAWSRMYRNVAYNVLRAGDTKDMILVRKLNIDSIQFWPLQLSAYLGIEGSFFSPTTRKWIHNMWLNLRYQSFSGQH
ncbi:MAG: glycosyltransferase [Anaerolineales bacterium]|nr:glycosyltransferase [Anaerolineales bacterium]